MEITVKFSAPEWASVFRAWKFVKRQLEPILVVGAGLLVTAWFVAFFAAMTRWMDYSDPEAGWIVVWAIITGAWGGLFAWLDTKKK